MEKINNEEINKILLSVEEKEKRSQRRTILFTVIPFIIGIIFLAYSSLTVYDKARELEAKRDELVLKTKTVDSLSAYVMNLKNDIRILEDSIQKSADLSQYIYQFNPVADKYISSLYPEKEVILTHIINLKTAGVSWYLGGQSPSVGFDSPNFALYILKQVRPGFNLLPATSNNETLSDRLLKTLKKTNTPDVGDVIFYPGGYVLFYFKDHNTPYVIGMTPRGIISLKPEFAKIVAIRESGI